jgi:bifunctional non-homologous end joining protein LigD
MTLPVGEPGWSYEMKVDGWRLAVHVPAGMLQSRRGTDLTARFPEVLAGARELGSVVLDGELVAYGWSGRLEFGSLNYGARRRAAEGVRLIYVAFDLLAYAAATCGTAALIPWGHAVPAGRRGVLADEAPAALARCC